MTRSSSAARDTVRAIVGPVLLMLTGGLFLLDYSGGYGVRQTWPLLMIWLGVGKILQHLVTPPDLR